MAQFCDEKQRDIPRLHSIRGIAALIVLVSHYSNDAALWGKLLGNGAGQLGVMLFFELSGFLMAYLYCSRPFRSREVRQFVVARIARVIPLYVISIVVSYLLVRLTGKAILFKIESAGLFLSHLLMLSGTAVLWTIPAEIQFYGLFLLMWWFYRRKGGYLFIVMMGVLIALFLNQFEGPQWDYRGLEIRTDILRSLPYFFIGVAFGVLYQCWQAPDAMRRKGFVGTLLLLFPIFPSVFTWLTERRIYPWADVGMLVIVSFVFFCQVFLVPDQDGILSHPFGVFLGRISYSLYLVHWPVLSWTSNWWRAHPLAGLLPFTALCVLLAWVSHKVIEDPARRWIRRRWREGSV